MAVSVEINVYVYNIVCLPRINCGRRSENLSFAFIYAPFCIIIRVEDYSRELILCAFYNRKFPNHSILRLFYKRHSTHKFQFLFVWYFATVSYFSSCYTYKISIK